jgi:hypothetical protein
MKRAQKMKKLTYLLTLIILIFPFIQATPIKAQENAMGFRHEVIFPPSQQDNRGFWNLLLAPNTQETASILLTNTTNQEIRVNLSMISAKTNASGVIEYSPNELPFDDSLIHNIEDLVELPEYVLLAAYEERKIDLTITMPDENFDGMILGGLHLQQEPDLQAEEQNQATIINRFAFVVGMVLRNNNHTTIPELRLNEVVAGLHNHHNAILIDISNVQPEILSELTLNVQIHRLGSEEILFETQKSEMRMAPNTNILFPVDSNGQRLIAGEYTAFISATSGENVWQWHENFTITTQEASKLNRQAVGLLPETRGHNWWLSGGLVGLILAIIGILVKKSQENRQLKKQLKQQKLPEMKVN